MRYVLLLDPARTLFPVLILLLALIPTAGRAADPDPSNPQDACFDDGRVSERACSDLIAALSAGTGLSPVDQQALVSAYNNRGLARTRAGELEGAAEDLAEAASLAPDNWAVYVNRGNLMLTSGQPRAALADFQRAAELAEVAAPAALANSILAHRALLDTASAEHALVTLRRLIAVTPVGQNDDRSAPPADPLR
jgi:tetratricopeptide (TPR) repeat protein